MLIQNCTVTVLSEQNTRCDHTIWKMQSATKQVEIIAKLHVTFLYQGGHVHSFHERKRMFPAYDGL